MIIAKDSHLSHLRSYCMVDILGWVREPELTNAQSHSLVPCLTPLASPRFWNLPQDLWVGQALWLHLARVATQRHT